MRRTVVIKVGGRLQNDPRLSLALAAYSRQHNDSICIVHGGGDKVTELQRELGIVPTFVHGKRVTKHEDMELVRMVLSGSVNKGLVANLKGQGVSVIGISGEDNGLLRAKLYDGGSLGAVGDVVEVDTDLIEALFKDNYTLVVSPVSRSLIDGRPLNVNADDAAYAIATHLRANELLLLSDVEGVIGMNGLMSELHEKSGEELISANHINAGMVPKVRAAFKGVNTGIDHVRIAGIGYLLGEQAGTLISR